MVITRNYSLKNNRLDVRDFGILGDGATNNLGALQDLFANSHDVIIYFPVGVYLVGGTTDWMGAKIYSRNIVIEGDGMGLTVLKQMDPKGACISIVPDGVTLATSNGFVRIDGVEFRVADNAVDDGLNLGTVAGSLLVVQGTSDAWLDKVMVSACHFNRGLRAGIWVNRCRDLWLDSCTLERSAAGKHYWLEKPDLAPEENGVTRFSATAYRDETRRNIPSNGTDQGGVGGGLNAVHKYD